MRILHVAETAKGGVGTVIDGLVTAYLNICPRDCVELLIPSDAVIHVKQRASNYSTFTRTGRNLKSLLGFAIHYFWTILRFKPDIIHLHSTFAGAIGRILAAPFCLIRGTKVVYCPHAFAFVVEANQWVRLAYKAVERLLAPLCHAIICVSEAERRAAITAGIPSSKMCVIHNGIAESTCCTEIKDPYGVDAAMIRLLFVGRLDHQKGVDILERAFRRLGASGYHLTIIGEAVVGRGMVGRSDPVGPLANVTYKGWIPRSQLCAYYRYADVVVVPSRWEGFAMVPLEALGHGTAVVTSKLDSFRELVEQGVNGYCVDFQSDEFFRLLTSTSREEWRIMGNNGKNLVRKKFSAENMARKTAVLYRRIMESTRREAS